MSAIFLPLSVIFTRGCSGVYPRCPYPLAENIEPGICQVEGDNMEMTLNGYLTNSVAEAFDYNNQLNNFKMQGPTNRYSLSYPLLTFNNLGKLNITHFTLEKVQITIPWNAKTINAPLQDVKVKEDIFEEGAFVGSTGSIQSITLQGMKHGTVDLTTKLLHPACPTLRSLKLERVTKLSSTSFSQSPSLQEVTFQKSLFRNIPSHLFANTPNIQTISISAQESLTIEKDAFTNLLNLTKLDISTSISKVENYALDNLTNLMSELE